MKKYYFLILSVLGIAGCGGGGSDSFGEFSSDADYAAVIQTAAPSYDSSDIEIVDMSQENMSAVSGFSLSAQTDYEVFAKDEYFYQLGRNNIDALTKWDINNTGSAVWQYSTKSPASATANPHRLVFKGTNTAYIIRWSSNIAWEVDLDAVRQEDFKVGEVDLSAYADSDGLAEATNGLVIGDYLYVLMQRIDRDNGYAPNNTAYIAVFDISTNTEVDLNIDATLGGIPLQTRNPESIFYVEGLGLVVQSTGSYGTQEFTGIEVVNLSTYATDVLIDETDGYGQVTKAAIISNTIGYFVAYAGWMDTSVYRFNPSTGDVASSPLSGMASIDVRTLAADPNGMLWVGISSDSDPRMVIIDPANDSVADEVELNRNPISIAFTVGD